jgi:hypothetical protein
MKKRTSLLSIGLATLLVAPMAMAQDTGMSFFMTGTGSGDGANLGGLAGADAHCQALASTAGAGDRTWAAYLSTTGDGGENARDRIGSGPWYNANGVMIASNVDDLHSDNVQTSKENSVSENGDIINGRGDEPNMHDVLTGSMLDGTTSTADGDTTCGNWMSNSEDGSALAGHHDRQGGGDNPNSWNSAHPTRGCGQENLQATGGNGYYYCFATD